jgi:hypothetical protein
MSQGMSHEFHHTPSVRVTKTKQCILVKLSIITLLLFHRVIISHDIQETCQKHKNGKLFSCTQDIESKLKKGLVTEKLFNEIFKLSGKEAEAKKIKDYLLALNLAVDMENGQLFIPSLVSDNNEVNQDINAC